MACTVLTERDTGSCKARIGGRLTVQTDDFSHDEDNVHLSWLCLAIVCLKRQERANSNGGRWR